MTLTNINELNWYVFGCTFQLTVLRLTNELYVLTFVQQKAEANNISSLKDSA